MFEVNIYLKPADTKNLYEDIIQSQIEGLNIEIIEKSKVGLNFPIDEIKLIFESIVAIHGVYEILKKFINSNDAKSINIDNKKGTIKFDNEVSKEEFTKEITENQLNKGDQ